LNPGVVAERIHSCKVIGISLRAEIPWWNEGKVLPMRIRGFAPATPCWVELASADPARAADFYAGLFGWEPAGDRFKLNGRAAAGLTRADLLALLS